MQISNQTRCGIVKRLPNQNVFNSGQVTVNQQAGVIPSRIHRIASQLSLAMAVLQLLSKVTITRGTAIQPRLQHSCGLHDDIH